MRWPVLVALALLAVPRVVLHDLGMVTEGSLVNGLLVFVPPACWIAAVVWNQPPRPFRTVVVVGALYGVLLAVTHQVLWDRVIGGAETAAGAQEPIMRVAAVFSSVITGTLVGVVAGAVAAGLCRLVPAR
jgi:hypothetical protein